MDGYQRRTEHKKENIRRAAMELFSTYGIEKVSVAEIAKKANVSPVTIYNYFGTKDELFYSVLTTFLEDAWEKRLEMIRSDLPYTEKIEKMIFETTDFAGTVNPDFLREMMTNRPEMQRIVEDIYNRYVPELIRFIETGRDAGYINPDISTETILMYVNILKEAFDKIEVSGDRVKNRQLMKELTTVMFYGLMNKPESNR
ncbi:TetR/AcrR family transcriptional regulator [Paenibacillus tarimensis]